MISRSARRRPAVPEEHGDLIVYLASDADCYITGRIIAVDGAIGVQPMADLSPMPRLWRGDAIHDDACGTSS